MGDSRLDGQNNPVNFIGNGFKNGNDWLIANDVRFSKRYIEGNINITLKLSIGGCPGKYDLVFFSVPDGACDLKASAGQCCDMVTSPACVYPNWNNDSVFVAVTKSVQCENKVIASFVGAERTTERYDIRWDIFTSSFNNVFEFLFGIGDREISFPRIRMPRRNANSINSLIESRTESFDDFNGKIGTIGGEIFGEFDFMQFIDAVNILISDYGVWLVIKKPIDPAIKIIDVFVCARNTP